MEHQTLGWWVVHPSNPAYYIAIEDCRILKPKQHWAATQFWVSQTLVLMTKGVQYCGDYYDNIKVWLHKLFHPNLINHHHIHPATFIRFLATLRNLAFAQPCTLLFFSYFDSDLGSYLTQLSTLWDKLFQK